MQKVEILVSRESLHYVVERLSELDGINEIAISASELVRLKGKEEESKSIQGAKIEILVENEYIDRILQLLVGDSRISFGRIDILAVDRSLSIGFKEGYGVKLAFSVFIRASRKYVFTLVTDYDNLVKEFPDYFKKIEVRSQNENIAVTEEEIKIDGMTIKQLVRHTVYPPGVHEVEILSGHMEGSRITETYTETGDGTQVMVVGDFRLKKPLADILGFLAKKKIEDNIRKVMNEVAKIAESKHDMIEGEWK